MSEILLGTVAIEPNRWRGLDPSGAPATRLSEWLGAVAGAGFDGLEVWERHLPEGDDGEVEKVLASPLPIRVLNSYVSLDEADPTDRSRVSGRAARCGSRGIKFNVGNEPGQQLAYAERIAAWLAELPPEVALLCECHHGISIAEDPDVAREIFAAAGPPERLQAIVHTHEEPEALRKRFDRYGDRIRHVHVNFLDFAKGGAPKLGDVRDLLAARVALLRELGFLGSFTLEFVHGLLTENDRPAFLCEQAARDLLVLRDVLG